MQNGKGVDLINSENRVVRMRTIPKAYAEIKANDPDTSFSMRALRKLVNNGQIPAVKINNKVLINLDLLMDMLACYNDGAICA